MEELLKKQLKFQKLSAIFMGGILVALVIMCVMLGAFLKQAGQLMTDTQALIGTTSEKIQSLDTEKLNEAINQSSEMMTQMNSVADEITSTMKTMDSFAGKLEEIGGSFEDIAEKLEKIGNLFG